MKFDIMLTGVGGEGVLTAGVMLARAANLEGYYVRGVQLHGLAQRGGKIPTFVRFGSRKELSSPGIMQGDADLVIAFEPMEAIRAAYYARKEKTIFVINNYPYMPVYANILNVPYPSMEKILKKIKQFAKNVYVFEAHNIAKKQFGRQVFGNTLLIGIITGLGILPIKEKNLSEAIKCTAPVQIKENLAVFKRGIEIGKKYK